MILFLPLLLAVSTPADCRPVEGDRILSSDLARAIPAFAALPPEIVLGYSPMPGARRVMRVDELQRIAASHGVPPEIWPAVCFEFPMAPIRDDSAVQAMQQALGIEAKIEILSINPRLAPAGKLMFPRSSLVRPAGPDTSKGGQIWRGFVQFSGTRRYPVTATVHVSGKAMRVIATRTLPAGKPIEADGIRVELYEGFPASETVESEPAKVIGKLPRRTLQEGQWLRANDLSPVPDVRKGDRVQVQVRNGAARLELEGQAETGGQSGDWIQVKNLQSGKPFGARVEGPGRVTVTPRGTTGK